MKVYFNNKVIGTTKEDIFTTTRRPQHFFRKYGGFGISINVLDYLKEQGIKTIKLIYKGKKSTSICYKEIEELLQQPTIQDGADAQKIIKDDND